MITLKDIDDLLDLPRTKQEPTNSVALTVELIHADHECKIFRQMWPSIEVIDFYSELQKPLDPEFAEILYGNLWDLYAE